MGKWQRVESVATVLFKPTWRRRIIKDVVWIIPRHDVPRAPYSVWNWPRNEKEGSSLAALQPGAASSSFSEHSRRAGTIPEQTATRWCLSADVSSTKPNFSHNTNWLKTRELVRNPVSQSDEAKKKKKSQCFVSDAAQHMLLITQGDDCVFVLKWGGGGGVLGCGGCCCVNKGAWM